jgi:glutaredoxin
MPRPCACLALAGPSPGFASPVKLLILAVLAFGLWSGWQSLRGKAGGSPAAAADLSVSQIQALAATVKPEQVVMYSTTECPHCAQAKGWLRQYGFAFTDCNMSVERRCETEFRAFGATGTPYLVVHRAGKTHHMKDGFDSDELLAALQP